MNLASGSGLELQTGLGLGNRRVRAGDRAIETGSAQARVMSGPGSGSGPGLGQDQGWVRASPCFTYHPYCNPNCTPNFNPRPNPNPNLIQLTDLAVQFG